MLKNTGWIKGIIWKVIYVIVCLICCVFIFESSYSVFKTRTVLFDSSGAYELRSGEIMTQEKSAKNAMSGTEEVLVEDIEQRSIFRWSMKKYKKQMEDNAEKADETKDTKDENDVVWEELEQSIIARIADDVSISISGNNVEVIAFKGF